MPSDKHILMPSRILADNRMMIVGASVVALVGPISRGAYGPNIELLDAILVFGAAVSFILGLWLGNRSYPFCIDHPFLTSCGLAWRFAVWLYFISCLASITESSFGLVPIQVLKSVVILTVAFSTPFVGSFMLSYSTRLLLDKWRLTPGEILSTIIGLVAAAVPILIWLFSRN